MEARLIVDAALDGSWNMACDESLAQFAGESGVPVLRLYQWAEPTLSLGYFQRYSARDKHAASAHCSVVRRSSGGGALIHDLEWTYSLAVPRSASPTGESLVEIAHATLAQCFQDLKIPVAPWGKPGVAEREQEFLCFLRRTPHDLILDGHKVVGSAQRKRRLVVMQHGGILLSRSPFAPELPGVAELARPIDGSQLVNAWIDTLGQQLSWRLRRSQLSDGEKELANQLQNSRFLSNGWTLKRN